MGYFLSYSRRDLDAVQVLVSDLERTRGETWMDREMGGGEDWWQEILARIRSADVFVFAVSTNSLRSRPCLAELEYARALGIPLLPVQVGDVESFRISPVAEKQVIDYRPRSDTGPALRQQAEAAIDVVVAATDLARQRRPLPDPLPPPPPIPFEYLMQIRIALDAEELPARVQLQVLTQLKQAMRDEEDAEARRDIADLLRRLRRHQDTTYRNAVEVDELLAENPRVPELTWDEQTVPSPAPEDRRSGLSAATAPGADVYAQSPGPRLESLRWDVNERLQVAAIGLGALGVGQFGPAFVYDLRPLFGGFGYRQALPLQLTFGAAGALSVIGLVLGIVALRRVLGVVRRRNTLHIISGPPARIGAIAWIGLAVPLLGTGTVAALLPAYWGFW